MNKHHEDKLTMYLGVEAVLEENIANTDTVAALGAPIARFKSVVEGIKTKSKEFDLSITGKTQVKLEAEDALVDELIPAAGALAAYAHRSKDSELEAKATMTENSLRKLRDTELVTRANGIYELSQAKASSLADFAVTAETLATLRQRIDAYADALGRKEGGYSERTSLRKAMIDLFDEADTVLSKEIDPLMERFRKKETEFYNAYLQSRFIRIAGAPRKVKAPLAQPAN